MSGLSVTGDKMNVTENNFRTGVLYCIMKRSFSILLSFIFLASHLSMTIGTHFCGGEAVETRIILGEAHLGCGMIDSDQPCDDSENPNLTGEGFDETPCCENKYQTVQSTNEFLETTVSATFNVEFAVAIIYTTLTFDLYPKSSHLYITEYRPTIIEKDIQALFQTYLI